ETLVETQTLIALLADAEDQEPIRTKVRQLLKSIIMEMWMLVFEYEIPGSRGRVKKCRGAVLQVHFTKGHYRTIDVFVDAPPTARPAVALPMPCLMPCRCPA